MQVMIIEDNPVFLRSFSSMLQQHLPSIEIIGTDSAQDAIASLRTLVPDLVFIDVRLGKYSGLDLIKQVKTLTGQSVVAVLTSFDLPEYRSMALERGADYFFTKDVPAAEIVECIKQELLCQSLLGPANQPERTEQGIAHLQRRSM